MPWLDADDAGDGAKGDAGASASSRSSRAQALAVELRSILEEGRLKPHFQPILDLRTGDVHGFEGLIRGPSDSVLHSPMNLFGVASASGLLFETERACVQILSAAFSSSGQRRKLFVNVSPDALALGFPGSIINLAEMEGLGLSPDDLVIELTECRSSLDFAQLVAAADHYRQQGFAIAMDDLGEGFSSLRLWSELRPEYVKIDQHFIQGVATDPVKHQFLRSIQEIAHKTGAKIVAEGLETEADLAVVMDLGLEYGQGYLLGRPNPVPRSVPVPELMRRTGANGQRSLAAWMSQSRTTASKLMMFISSIRPDASQEQVHERFLKEPSLLSLPVVKDGLPVGLINRYAFLDAMSRPFSRELYGKKPFEAIMSRNILVVEHSISLHELSERLLDSDPRHILHGFIITRGGFYAGMGSSHDLMREITQMQIQAARYANPLTQLPGNVPINEHLDSLLEQDVPFVACYCDLDHFKPYNDVYGYQRGDEVIYWIGKLLESVCDPDRDFVGHIGGDDFLVVMRSLDWRERCERILERFHAGRDRFFGAEHLAAGGYTSEDRLHRPVFHPLFSLSIGAVPARSGAFSSHHEIAAAVATAKKEAKAIEGCSLFVERRESGFLDSY